MSSSKNISWACAIFALRVILTGVAISPAFVSARAQAQQTDQQTAIFRVDFDVSEARQNFGGHLAQVSHPTRARALSLMALGGACA